MKFERGHQQDVFTPVSFEPSRPMKRMSHCCTLASVSALVMLTVFPVMIWSSPQPSDTQTQSDARCCGVQDFAMKRFEDIGQDSFVSLFGRRNAPKPRILDRILGGHLGKDIRGKDHGVIKEEETPRFHGQG